jgi:pimeloyl-[acyl-carrier protein] methyl ester esterase
MARLQVADGRSIYYEHHAGSRLPVMLIHGWGMSCRVWDTTLTALKQAGHEVIAFDQRCCGMSDKDFATTSIASSAQDATQLARQLGKERLVLNGWSLGGAIAVATAALLGKSCAGIVLTAAATPRYTQAEGFPYGGPAGAAAQTVAALRADRANFLMALTKGVCAEPPSPAVEQWLWSIFMQASPAADDALADLDQLDQRAALAALDIPVLSIVGARDAIVPPDICRHAASIAKHGRVAEFAQSGHAPFLEEGTRYREVLLDFLESVG